ncbi:MAG: MarR family transcriptional regulator [Nitrolancea sp.]
MISTVATNGAADVTDADGLVDLLRRAFVQFQPGVESLAEYWPQLTLQQLRVMHILYCDGPTRVSTLAQRLKVSTPTVTGILDRLVNRGMTSRDDDPSDRRVVLNLLTPDGVKVIEHLHPVKIDHLNGLIERFNSHDRKKIYDGLNLLLSASAGAS